MEACLVELRIGLKIVEKLIHSFLQENAREWKIYCRLLQKLNRNMLEKWTEIVT